MKHKSIYSNWSLFCVWIVMWFIGHMHSTTYPHARRVFHYNKLLTHLCFVQHTHITHTHLFGTIGRIYYVPVGAVYKTSLPPSPLIGTYAMRWYCNLIDLVVVWVFLIHARHEHKKQCDRERKKQKKLCYGITMTNALNK